ncbi:MAG: MgtC/SapB family protein [Candidatus Omnitrophota bacterium]
MEEELVILARISIATLLGGIVGLEREQHGRAAGLRTHILVCVSSCLVMCLSMFLAEHYKSDPARIAGQVLSGIGFLGAGTILRFRVSVRGLTTAASLWAVAGIGIAVGAGYYFGALVTTSFVLMALYWFTKIADKLMTHRDWFKNLEIEMKGTFEGLEEIREILSAHQAEIRDFNVAKEDAGQVTLTLELRLMSSRDQDPIMKEAMALEGVKRALWKEV